MFIIIAFSILVLIYPEQTAQAISRGIDICMQSIVPSLLPFMVISCFAVKSGFADWIGKYTDKFCKIIFDLPGCCFSVILMGMCGGYLVGSKMAAQLYRDGKISHGQFERLLCFCVNAGPAFIIGTVGVGILNNKKAGVLIFIAQIISALIIGVLVRFFIKSNDADDIPVIKNNNITNSISLSDAFVCSVTDAVKSLFYSCSFIVIFEAIYSLLNECGAIPFVYNMIFTPIGISNNTANALIPVIVEVTQACFTIGLVNIPLLCFALGWSGLSVHFQIYSSLNGIKFSKLRFMLSRFLAGALSAFIIKLLLKLFPIEQNINYDIEAFSPYFSTKTPLAALAFLLFGLMLAWQLIVPKYKQGKQNSTK